jgi:hypothetical protein
MDNSRVTTLLGLAPGYRFLLSGDYIDVSFDASLLAYEFSATNSSVSSYRNFDGDDRTLTVQTKILKP